jgi:hypothetical protein
MIRAEVLFGSANRGCIGRDGIGPDLELLISSVIRERALIPTEDRRTSIKNARERDE